MKLEQDTQYRYTPDAGALPEGEAVYCGVCGDEMTCRRGVVGARGIAQAMAGSKSTFDEFLCPNHRDDWHQQVVALRRESENTPSGYLAELYRDEINDILVFREATKPGFKPNLFRR